MPAVHKPTLLTAVVIIIVLFIAYHFLAGKVRK